MWNCRFFFNLEVSVVDCVDNEKGGNKMNLHFFNHKGKLRSHEGYTKVLMLSFYIKKSFSVLSEKPLRPLR